MHVCAAGQVEESPGRQTRRAWALFEGIIPGRARGTKRRGAVLSPGEYAGGGAAGEFYRAFQLPADFDTDKIQAGLKQGTLTIRLPKKETARSRKVEIKAD